MRSRMTRPGGVAALALVALFSVASLASAEGWGTIKGKITYEKDAKLPDNPEVNITADKPFCTKDGKIYRDEWVVDSKTRGIKNVIVWLTSATASKVRLPDWDEKLIHKDLKEVPKKLEVDQPICSFTPRVIVLREGTELIFKNSAKVSHNVSIDGGDMGPKINTAIPAGKDLSVGSVKARHLPIEYKCTIHPWMKGWLISFRHPYYAVTNEKGEFEIKNAPAGKWRLQIWHEGAGFVQKDPQNRGVTITVEDGKTTQVDKQLVKED